MVDIDRIRELAELMGEHDLSGIRIREGETTIDLRKGPTIASEPAPVPIPATNTEAKLVAAPETEGAGGEREADEGLLPIKSPMVGTFYMASDPDSSPFVSVGSEVTPDTAVCIIEAMKVFNEIKAEVAGTIERILVQNEQAIEFGQPLMLVRPKD